MNGIASGLRVSSAVFCVNRLILLEGELVSLVCAEDNSVSSLLVMVTAFTILS